MSPESESQSDLRWAKVTRVWVSRNFTFTVELQRSASSLGRSSNLFCSLLVGGATSADAESSSLIGGTCSAAGGPSERSEWGQPDEVGGDSQQELSAGGGGGSVGATNGLIDGGKSGGVVVFSGWCLNICSAESLGFGARGGVDLGRWTSSRVPSYEGIAWGKGGGLGEEGGAFFREEESEVGVSSDWLVRLIQGLRVGLDLRLWASGVSLDEAEH